MNGADGIRTHDPLVANQVLSQLSYRPLSENRDGGDSRVVSSRRQDAETPGGHEERGGRDPPPARPCSVRITWKRLTEFPRTRATIIDDIRSHARSSGGGSAIATPEAARASRGKRPCDRDNGRASERDAIGWASGPPSGVHIATDSGAVIPGARCRAARQCPGGSKSRNRLSGDTHAAGFFSFRRR